MDSHTSLVVNCMLMALKNYPFKIYINDSNGLSAFNPITELNLTNELIKNSDYVGAQSGHSNAR